MSEITVYQVLISISEKFPNFNRPLNLKIIGGECFTPFGVFSQNYSLIINENIYEINGVLNDSPNVTVTITFVLKDHGVISADLQPAIKLSWFNQESKISGTSCYWVKDGFPIKIIQQTGNIVSEIQFEDREAIWRKTINPNSGVFVVAHEGQHRRFPEYDERLTFFCDCPFCRWSPTASENGLTRLSPYDDETPTSKKSNSYLSSFAIIPCIEIPDKMDDCDDLTSLECTPCGGRLLERRLKNPLFINTDNPQ